MKVGFATKSDVSEIVKIQRTMLTRFKKRRALKHGFLVNPVTEKKLKAVAANQRRELLISAKEGKQVVGYAYAFDLAFLLRSPKWNGKLRFNETGWKKIRGKTVIYIKHVARTKESTGVGKELEKKLFDEARKVGYDSIVGEIMIKPAKNEASFGAHKASGGWTEIGKVTYSNGEVWALVMKNLK